MGVQDVDLSLYLNGAFVATPLHATPVTIIRGHDPYGSFPHPSSFTCEIDNDSLDYDPSRPASMLYGIAGRNTMTRIRPNGSTRLYGQVSSWEVDRTEDHEPGERRGRSSVRIKAEGLQGQIGRWRDRLGSAMKRAVLLAIQSGAYDVAEYWPMEDAAGSGTAVSAVGGPSLEPVAQVRSTLPDGSDLPPGGAPRFGDGNGVPGSDPLPSFQGGGSLHAVVRSRTFDGYAWDFVAQMGTAGSSATVLSWEESGTYVHFEMTFFETDVSVYHSNAADRATLSNTGAATALGNPYDGKPHHYRYQVRQSGGNYLAQFYIDGTLRATADNFVPGMAGTVGRPTEVEWNQVGYGPALDGAQWLPQAAGHLILWASGQVGGQRNMWTPMNGNRKELSQVRFDRIMTELGLGTFYSAPGEVMGPQPSGTLLEHLAQIRDTDGGRIDDERFGIAEYFRTRKSLFAQASSLDLVYPGDITPPFRKTIDNVGNANRVTVRNWNGAEITKIRETGPMSVLAAPDGIGDYPKTINVNVHDDARLPLIANWHLARGTLGDAEYRAVTVDLVANPHLETAVIAVREGDRITVTGADPDTLSFMVVGIVERPTAGTRTVTFKLEPWDVWDVGVWDDGTWQWDTRSTTLAEDLTTTETGVDFTTADRRDVLSTATPYDLMIGGERVTLTSMGAPTGSGPYLQTGTVDRSANDVVKLQAIGTEVHVAQRRRWGL